MRKKMLAVFLAGMIVLSFGLASCSTDQAGGEVQMVGSSDVPLYDRATPDDGALEVVRQSVYDSEVATLPDMNVEVTAYTTDATADEIVAWYDETLVDWTKYEGMEKDGSTMARWGQGNDIAFALYYSPDPSGGDVNPLILEYAWKK